VWPWQEVVQSLEEYSYALLLSLATAHGTPERAFNSAHQPRSAAEQRRLEVWIGLRLSFGVIPIF
jgi:hypothetical protein